MKVEYKVVSIADAKSNNYPAPYGEDEWDEDYYWDDENWFCGIWLIRDNKAIQCITTDGGEPEDQYLRRDGSWIAPALNKAYKQGYEDALNENEI